MASQLVIRDIEEEYQVEMHKHPLFILVKERLPVALATGRSRCYLHSECQRTRKAGLTADLS
jgi:hypothetical protein